MALGRITFPYLLFISMAAMLSGVLQAGQRFAAAAFAPILLNLALIVLLLASGAEGVAAARLLAWGVTGAGLLQLLWVAVATARHLSGAGRIRQTNAHAQAAALGNSAQREVT